MLGIEGIDELESYEYDVTEMGNVRMNAPSGQHDDCVAAVALTVWQFERKIQYIEEMRAFRRSLR